ncbi:cellulase N-terminal Ig-like domain-containing protein [Sphingomonas panni]
MGTTCRAWMMAALLATSSAGVAQTPDRPPLRLDRSDYFEAPGVNWLIFSNVNEGLFADAKISGVELIQQGVRTATNGDVRLSSTPGQWDPSATFVRRRVDKTAGVIEVTMRYPDFGYTVRAERRGGAVVLSVLLNQALPAAQVGKAGLNLEFVPSAYFHKSYAADGKPALFPRYPADAMTLTPERNLASGRSDGPGAEPQAFASGRQLILAPEDPARRVAIATREGTLSLFDGRNQAQNGWYVVRQLLPGGRTGKVIEWTLDANSVPDWLRPPVIGHSQVGYRSNLPKVATIELDRDDRRALRPRLLRLNASGIFAPVAEGSSREWGNYLRYRYVRFDFSDVTTPGTYAIDYGTTRSSPFPIGAGALTGLWHLTNDVYLPIAMDHVTVNEAYRVWHGDLAPRRCATGAGEPRTYRPVPAGADDRHALQARRAYPRPRGRRVA